MALPHGVMGWSAVCNCGISTNMFKPASNFLTDRFKVVLLLWIPFVICVSCLTLSYCLVCSLQHCGYLLGKGWSLGSLVFGVFLCFVTFLDGYMGHVRYLIVSIPVLL